MPKFRAVVEQYYGKALPPFRPLPAWEFKDYLGWMEQVRRPRRQRPTSRPPSA